MTLEPGDVIATGAPRGAGLGFDPPRYFRPGDLVEVEIDGIGVLVNPVVWTPGRREGTPNLALRTMEGTWNWAGWASGRCS